MTNRFPALEGFERRFGHFMKLSLYKRDRRYGSAYNRRALRGSISKRHRLYREKEKRYIGSGYAYRLRCPSTLSLQNKKARTVTLNFISNIRRRANNILLHIDMSELVLMYPTGTLLLTAELDRLRRHGGSRFQTLYTPPADKIARQVCQQVGIAAICGSKEMDDESAFDESVRHWRFATGVQMNDVPGRALDRFEGRLPDVLKEGIWKGVSEAVVNSVQHAYLEPRIDGTDCADDTRWWMFSQVRDGELTVAVCDLGIGIPRSLPIRWEGNAVMQLMSKFGLAKPEVAAIRAALEIGATRTGLSNRGRGLPQIWHDMKKNGAARMVLLSNHALLAWQGDEGGERERQFDNSILGTLVVWTVPIQEKIDV